MVRDLLFFVLIRRQRGGKNVRTVSVLLRAFLNFVPGFFHVLAETVGGVAAHADDGQERDDE